jgi:hypothetical protein
MDMGKAAFVSFILLLELTLAPRSVWAYGSSEREEMKADVREALSRAHDFSSQKMREATESLERERGAIEVKKKRQAFEAEQEETRQDYVKERNSRPSDFLTQARAERTFDEQKIIEDREMEKDRRQYARDHRKVQRIIRSKAFIDEAQEYGL